MDTFRRLVKRAAEWNGSSVREYAGVDADEPERRCGREIDPAWRECRPMGTPASEGGSYKTGLR
jgi:hypothetical protein